MSLLYNDFIDKKEIKGNDCFYNLFMFSRIINSSNLILPATKLTRRCYTSMFAFCSDLISAPKVLPAKETSIECYCSMFINCLSLTRAPELPATTLASDCYISMFSWCVSLKELHYPKSIENDTTFKSMSGSPWFGATNATIYYDL